MDYELKMALLDAPKSLSEYIDQLEHQLKEALAACEAKDDHLKNIAGAINADAVSVMEARAALAVRPNASTLRNHDALLITQCAGICDRFTERGMSPAECASAIRQFKDFHDYTRRSPRSS